VKALLMVDVQNDFCPGGALAVAHGDEVVAELNAWRRNFPLVVLTQDWHPASHGSFAINHPGKRPGDTIELAGLSQILWPAHCVQGSKGAEFHPRLEVGSDDPVFRKGTDPLIDSYSAFYDNAHRKSTGLADFFREKKVDEIHIGGLATDYCVLFTVLDALAEGFKVNVIEAACRGVNLRPQDSTNALDKMRKAGARLV